MRISPLVVAGTFGAAILAAPTAKSCELRVVSSHADAAWDQAVSEARSVLSSRAGDCELAGLQIDEGAAVLTYATVDGRQARRTVSAPSELLPTLEALLVPLPALEAPAPSVQRSAAENERADAIPPPPAPNLFLSALLGARMLVPDGFASLNLTFGATLAIEKWELGVTAQWDPKYYHTDDDDRPNAQLRSISAGVAVGRRARLRSAVLAGGATVSASILHEEWSATSGVPTERENERGQALAGLYASWIYPAKVTTHCRATVFGDVDATHLGGSRTVPGDPYLPWWSLTFAVGVESEVF
jgi:hypothetical protein